MMLHLPVLALTVVAVLSLAGWRHEHETAVRLRRERDDEMRRAADQQRRAQTAEDELRRLLTTWIQAPATRTATRPRRAMSQAYSPCEEGP